MPVEIPLDKICVRTGVLCPRCQSLVDRGLYNDLDIRVMRALLEVERKYRDTRIRFVKAYRIDDIVYVLVESSPGVPASLGADIRKHLDVEGVERVLVVEYRADKRRLIEEIIAPYRVIGIQEAFLPDGGEVVIVKVPVEARRLLESIKGRYILRLAEKLLGKQVYIEYVESSEAPLKPEWLGLKKPDVRGLLDRLG